MIAVLLRRHGLEEITAHQLLGDGRASLREDRGTVGRVSTSHLGKAPQQIQDPEFADYARKSGVVDSVMREEILVLGGRGSRRETTGGMSSSPVISRYSEAISMNGPP